MAPIPGDLRRPPFWHSDAVRGPSTPSVLFIAPATVLSGDHPLRRPGGCRILWHAIGSCREVDSAVGKDHGSGRPATDFAVEAQASAVQLGHDLDEGKAETGSLAPPAQRAVDLDERLQNQSELLRRNADPR